MLLKLCRTFVFAFLTLVVACNVQQLGTKQAEVGLLQPSETVQQFFEFSLSGDGIRAIDLTGPATVSDIYWRPDSTGRSSTDNRFIEPKAGSDGIGTADPQRLQNEFQTGLREWPGLIREQQFSISSVIGETVISDRAEVKAEITRSGWVDQYELRVLLRRIDGTWKIIAIWDGKRNSDFPTNKAAKSEVG